MALKLNIAKRLEQRRSEISQQQRMQNISSEEENHEIANQEQMKHEMSDETYNPSSIAKDKIDKYTVYDDFPMDTDEFIDKTDKNDYDEYVRNRQAEAVNYYGNEASERDNGTKILKRFKVEAENTSRYRNAYRVLNNNDEQYIETYDEKKIQASSDDSYHQVTAKDKDRLDLISFHYYKTPLLWWVIAEASGIIDPFHVPVNTVLRIPSISSIYSYDGILAK